MLALLRHIKSLIRVKKSGASILRSIHFNLVMLPFKEAIRLPFILYGKVLYDECVPYKSGGGFHRLLSERLNFNSWQIGYPVYHLEASNLTTKLIFKGRVFVGARGRIYSGASVIVQPKALLSLGTGFSICSYSRLICYNKVKIGNNVIISWECQIFDTNFHYISDENGDIKRRNGQVVIGDDVWVANRTTIVKGSLPANSIIASNSLVNKDFSKSESGLFAGMPAKLVHYNQHAEFAIEGVLNDFFSNNPDIVKVNKFEIEK